MNELIYVLKCLAITAVVVVLSQVHIGGGASIENKVEDGLRNSKPAVWVQGVAAGGALAISRGYQSVKGAITGESHEVSTRAQRAGF